MIEISRMDYTGDFVKSFRLKRGLEIRPLWKKMERMDPDSLLIWAERFDSISPVAAGLSVAMALEKSAKFQVSLSNQYSRTIAAEINRLVWLVNYLGNSLKSISPEFCVSAAFLLREKVFATQEELFGGRVLVQSTKLGGLRRGFALGDLQKIRNFVEQWRAQWREWRSLVDNDPARVSRFSGVMVVPPALVQKYSWWGIVGKSSGVAYDSRLHRPYGAYPHVDFEVPMGKNGDAETRFQVALLEVELSLTLIEKLLAGFPQASLHEVKEVKLNPGFYTGWAESGSGPFVSVLEVGADCMVHSVRIFSSDQRALPLLEKMLVGVRADDFWLALNSLGVSLENGELS